MPKHVYRLCLWEWGEKESVVMNEFNVPYSNLARNISTPLHLSHLYILTVHIATRFSLPPPAPHSRPRLPAYPFTQTLQLRKACLR